MPWIRWVANAFVLAYAADACLSGLDEAVRAGMGSTALLVPRGVLARTVLWASFCVPIAVALTPRLPAALFLLVSLSALWLNFGAAPLPLWVDSRAMLAPTLVGIQLLVSVLAFAWIRRRNGGTGWLLRDSALAGRAFSPWRTLAWIAGLVLVGLPGAGLYVLLWLATSIQLATHGFVAFDGSGAVLADRHYTLADREVRLVGMMHVGEGESYREIVRSFVGADTAVLQEGVTDAEGRLGTRLSYGRTAAVLGLDEQEPLETYSEEPDGPDEEPAPVFLRADVDAATFAPETIAWLDQLARVHSADDFWPAVRAFAAWASQRPNEWPIVERDLVARRNEHLVGRLDEALLDYRRVVVPWGALHLPGIEAVLLGRGYVRTREAHHRLFHWSAVAATLAKTFAGGRGGN